MLKGPKRSKKERIAPYVPRNTSFFECGVQFQPVPLVHEMSRFWISGCYAATPRVKPFDHECINSSASVSGQLRWTLNGCASLSVEGCATSNALLELSDVPYCTPCMWCFQALRHDHTSAGGKQRLAPLAKWYDDRKSISGLQWYLLHSSVQACVWKYLTWPKQTLQIRDIIGTTPPKQWMQQWLLKDDPINWSTELDFIFGSKLK